MNLIFYNIEHNYYLKVVQSRFLIMDNKVEQLIYVVQISWPMYLEIIA